MSPAITKPRIQKLCPADDSNFIDRLPPEVANTVCSFLPSIPDIANVRLVSKFWTNVATPRLLPEVHLIL